MRLIKLLMEIGKVKEILGVMYINHTRFANMIKINKH